MMFSVQANTSLSKSLMKGLQRFFGSVIVNTQMSKADMAEIVVSYICQESRSLVISQMTSV
jgi:hypothetical protein